MAHSLGHGRKSMLAIRLTIWRPGLRKLLYPQESLSDDTGMLPYNLQIK